MNSIERLTKLSGIYTLTESFGEKKYADRDKAGLQAVKKELQGIMATAARASFKYKNAAEELKLVNECIKKLEDTENKEVKEAAEEACVVEPVVEAKKDDDKEEKEDKKDSDSDDKKDDDKDSKKDSDKEDKEDKKDDKPAFLKDKEDNKDSDKEDKKDSDKKEEKEDKESDDKKDDKDDSDKKDKKDSDKEDKKDDDDGEKTVKVEVKVEETESVDDIVARIMEKDLTPTKVDVDYENGPTENSGIKFEQGTKIRLPNAVKAEVKQRIAELNQAILRYDDKGYDDKSIKQQAVDCLNQILQDLSTNDLEGVKKAQVYLTTLMSPLTDFFPPKIINWLANATNPYVGDESA